MNHHAKRLQAKAVLKTYDRKLIKYRLKHVVAAYAAGKYSVRSIPFKDPEHFKILNRCLRYLDIYGAWDFKDVTSLEGKLVKEYVFTFHGRIK